MRHLRRSGASEQLAMSISGHKTRSMFDRHDIVCNDDKVIALAALEKAQARARKARAAQAAKAARGSHKEAIVTAPPGERVQ